MDEHDHHFTPEADDEGWSTTEEERTFLLVRDLLMELRDRGSGIYIVPVQEGTPAAGLGSNDAYGVDGWVVGEYTADGRQDLAVGPWLSQVVEAARAATKPD